MSPLVEFENATCMGVSTYCIVVCDIKSDGDGNKPTTRDMKKNCIAVFIRAYKAFTSIDLCRAIVRSNEFAEQSPPNASGL